jgi:hypothetical protein
VAWRLSGYRRERSIEDTPIVAAISASLKRQYRYIANEVPQPHDELAFGLRTWKDDPISSST